MRCHVPTDGYTEDDQRTRHHSNRSSSHQESFHQWCFLLRHPCRDGGDLTCSCYSNLSFDILSLRKSASKSPSICLVGLILWHICNNWKYDGRATHYLSSPLPPSSVVLLIVASLFFFSSLFPLCFYSPLFPLSSLFLLTCLLLLLRRYCSPLSQPWR